MSMSSRSHDDKCFSFSATDARYDVCLRVCRVLCAKVVGTTSSDILRVYNIDDGSLIR